MQSEVESKDLASYGQTPQNLALDLWEDKWRVAKGPLDNISVSEPTSDELQDLLKNQDPNQIFATEESKDVLAALMRNGKAVNLLPRLLAIYWSLGAELKNQPCIVISVGASHTKAGLIVEGDLVRREETLSLSVRSMWAKHLETIPRLKKRVTEDLEFDEKLFQSVLSAMSTGELVNVEPRFPLRPPIDFGGPLEDFKNCLNAIDPDETAKLVILSDWAATSCKLGGLLERNGRTILIAGKDKPFVQAVSGLVVFSQTPDLKLEEDEMTFPNAAVGQRVQKNLRIENVGAGLLQALIISNRKWLKATPSKVSCRAKEKLTVSIEVDTSGFQIASSHSSELEFQWPIGTRTERKRIAIHVTMRSPFLCCPNQQCGSLVLPDNSACSQCGAEGEPASPELWVKKRVKPALESDLINLLKNSFDVLQSADEMGLSRNDAEEGLDSAFNEESGVNRDTLLEWVRIVEPLERAAKTADWEQAKANAEQRKIKPDCYNAILRRLRPPKLDVFPKNLSLRFSDDPNETTETLSCRNTGGGTLTGNASADAPWISINPDHLDGNALEQELSVAVKKRDLPREKKLSTKIILKTSGGSKTVPVDVELPGTDWKKVLLGLVVLTAVVLLGWYQFLRDKPVETITLHRTLSRDDHGSDSHADSVSSLAFSPDGMILASGSADCSVNFWDAHTWGFSRSIKYRDQVRAVAFSPDGKIFASATAGKVIRLTNIQTGDFKTLEGHDAAVEAIAFSPDGNVLVSGGKDNTVRIWDVPTGQLTATLVRTSNKTGPRYETSHTDEVTSVAFSPDGKTIASGGADYNVILWDTESRQIRQSVKPQGQVRSIAFSPNGKLLASADNDKTVTLWDSQTGERKALLTGHVDSVESLAFSPNSKILASGGKDGTVRVWDVESGQLRWTLAEHSDWVCSVIFSRDGKTLASASKDHTVKVWDLQ